MNDDVAEALMAALRESDLTVALFDAQDQLRWCNASDASAAQALPRRRDAAERAHRLETPDGRTLWISETPLADGGLLLVASDVSRLTRPSNTPDGEASSRDVLALAGAALDDMLVRRQPLSIAVVEIDDASRLGAGEAPLRLRHFVRHCRHHLRPGDTLGHLRGSQFMLLLPGAGPLAAMAIVERLQRRLGEPLPGDSAAVLHYGFSAGVAAAKAGEPLDTLMQRTRRALDSARPHRIVLDAAQPA
jgi:GGDEF domain-containing protein